ncbi:MAG TPA: ABC transporter substrate-binding protein, partial [Sporichthyaceae bacterium]
MALIAGCGGSRVASSADTATQSTSGDTAASSTDSGAAANTGAAASTDTGSAPAATDTGSAPAASSTVANAAAPAAATNTDAVTKGAATSTKAAAKGATKTSAAGAAVNNAKLAGAGATVAQNVASQQIFGGKAPCQPANLSPINIGNVSTLSGVLGQLFAPVVPGLKTFVAAQNACGGLNGHPIRLFVEDDQGDPSTAVTKINDEIKNAKVLAFVGNIQVLTVDAVVATIKRAGIPVIGGDITNNTWFSNPLMFPQGSPPQAISYGYTVAATDYFKKKSLGDIWCLEVPQACAQIDKALKEIGPQVGVNVVKTTQVSITSPSYTTQCLDFKNAGVEVLAMTFDAASQNRLAKSCDQVGFHPNWAAYPLGVGNEKQFLGSPLLGNTYVPLNTFPWMGNETPAEQYYQASVKKFNPGFTSGDAASLGWTAGALLVAASTNLSANP